MKQKNITTREILEFFKKKEHKKKFKNINKLKIINFLIKETKKI